MARNNVQHPGRIGADAPPPANGPRKDQLCVNFGRGLCQRGDKCYYAHSLEEQRTAIKRKESGFGASQVRVLAMITADLAQQLH